MTDKQWARACHDQRDDREELLLTLYAWADEREEEGQADLSQGLRLLADYQHGPRCPWYMGPTYSWTLDDGDLKTKSHLPAPAWSRLTGKEDYSVNPDYYSTEYFKVYLFLHEAFLDAARVFLELEREK
jgi:hypothetical protein